MLQPIVVPELNVPSIVLSVWYVKPGEKVYVGDRLVELLLGSATFDVTATEAGKLAEQCVWADEVLTPGQLLGYLQPSRD